MGGLKDYLISFEMFIRTNKLFNPDDRILLAVSGGCDSVCMVHFFFQAGYCFEIAHVNFKLRGKDADRDEAFVKELGREMQVPVHTTGFDTLEYAKDHKLSIQMAARTLRYEWLECVRNKTGCKCIATAHHQSDVIETVLINLLRGTGLKGLHGIQAKKTSLIRPLLFLSRKDIEGIILHEGIKFREDGSNASSKYIRNKLRHEVIPLLREIVPNLESVFNKTTEHMKASENLLKCFLNQKREELLLYDRWKILINIEQLKSQDHVSDLLFELLQPYDFKLPVVQEIVATLDAQSGKRFISESHILIKDRSYLIISKLSNEIIPLNFHGLFDENVIENKGVEIPCDPHIACLDYDKLKHPLKVRYPLPGDAFIPLGMTKQKKLSDFFIDLKLSIIEKQKTLVVLSGKEIVWVVGYRINERYKISSKTRKIYIFTLKDKENHPKQVS